MPTSPADAGKVISFPGLSSQPVYGTNYTLVQTANDKLELKYDAGFLKDYEWSTKDIGAEITFVSTDGRPFNKKFYLKLKVNTPPPKPTAVLAQTNSASPTYVLCLQVPDMGVSVTGGKLHKDIAQIEINGTSYPLTVSGGDFVKPSDAHFITAVTQLAGYPVPPSGNWVLYYDTQLPVGNAYRAYTVKLKDNKGLVSAVLETGTARPQLPAETVNITRGQQSTGSGLGGTTGDPIIINGETSAPEAQITIQNIAGTTVHCEVQEVVGGSATGAVSPYDGNPVNVPLGLGTANEKLYEVKYHTDGTGYTASAVTTKYYKVLKCHSVTFDANGGTFTDGSTTSTSRTVLVPHGTVAAAPSTPPTKTGYHVDGWYTEAACTTQWNFSTQTITGDKQLYAKWAPNSGTSYRVEHYKEDLTENQYTSPPQIENLTGTTGAPISVTLKSYEGFQVDRQDPPSATIAADGSTVVKVYYKRNTINVVFNLNGGDISGSTANVTRSGRFGTALTAPANPVKTGYTFSGWSPLLSTSPVFPASDTTYTAQWHKNPKVTFKVYNGTGGSLKGTYGSSTQTAGNPPAIPEPSFTVTYGGSISFEALPDLAWEVDSWTASPGSFSSGGGTGSITAALSNITQDTEVIVKFKKTTTIKSTDPQPWKLLKEVVSIADNNAVITINGEIKATNEGSAGVDANWGEIEINKNLTIKKADGATTAVLNANSNHATAPADAPATPHRIFKVTGNKKLTLQNLTLKDGKDEGTPGVISQGGAITVSDSDGKAELTNCIIEDCQAKYGGAIGCYSGTTVTLTNTTIQKCKATERGGAIFAEDATVNITSCTLKGNEAKVYGGGVYAFGTTVTLTNCTLKGNTAKSGGAIYAEKRSSTVVRVTIEGGIIGGTGEDANKATGTGTDNGMGGGIWVGDTCSLNLKDSTDPSSGVQRLRILGNLAQKGTGIYAKNTIVSMKDTLQIDTNNDVYLDDGTKIRADNDLNPPGGITARITVPDDKYNTSTQVLIANHDVNLANQAGKFTVTRGGSPAKNWFVGSNGNLTDDPAAIFATISKDQIKAFESNMETTTNYQYNNNNLKGRLIFYKTNNGNYGVMLIADTPSIGTDVYNLKFKYKTYSKHDGTILKNGDTTVEGTYSFDLDTGTQSTSTAPLNDTKDFFLYGSTYIAPQNGAKFYVLP